MITFNDFGSGGGGGGGVSGSGTVPYLPIWDTTSILNDSRLSHQYAYNYPLNNVYDPDFLVIESAFVSTYNLANLNGGGGSYDMYSNTTGSAGYYGGMTMGESGGGFDSFNVYFSDAFGAGFQELYIANITNTPVRLYRLFESAFTFFQHNGYNAINQTYHMNSIFGGEYNSSVPDPAASNYALFIQNATTIADFTSSGGNFNGGTWIKNYWRLFNVNTFASANVVSSCLIGNELQVWGGATTINQALTGIRTWSQLAIFPQFQVVSGASTFNALSGIQILGIYDTYFPGFGATLSVNTYYALLINDTAEYNHTTISVTNRYAIYQAGVNDQVQFFGLMGFYGATPQSQATTAITNPAWVHNAGGTALKTVDTILGYTLGQVVQALKDYGLLA